MPFVETILFDDDKRKIKKINDLISKNILKVFKTKNNTITIYNNIIKKKIFIIILELTILKKEFLLKFQA